MKRIYSLAILATFILSFTSCEDFMDMHKEYIKGGEIIYAPKPDSVYFIAGKGRVLFNCRTYNAPNVRSIDVYWNDGLDSLIIPVELKTGYDSISVILDNLEEKSYTFKIQATDNFGHKSLFMTDFGTSYGDTYQATLNDRLVESLTLSDQEGTIKWYYAPQYLVRSEVRYVKKNGSQAIVKVPSTDDLVQLPDVKPGSTFEYRSLYIPEEVAIDTFATAWKEYETPFPAEYKYDRSSWEVLSVSDVSTSEGGGMATLIDGDLSTYWQSAYEGGDAPLPHWAVIDMQTPKNISRVELYRRTGNKDTKSIELYVSDHPDANAAGWIKIGTVVFEEGDSSSITIPGSIDMKGRYLKLLLSDSNREPYTSVAEVYVYGK
ncbi:hypothetical protein CE91St1_37450 [Parabacteroides goldsteinii]|uniref:DUF4998 domain-containing protein n=1 Tax=Parabacteroides goldsteinii TaxID=328812 RepID=UPI001FBA921A|nr:DUF4998 domain-containing protein [Parabacteroides goldsteinii]GKG74602.1 hypothetical protein CE91St1_37450 [Parabacteroides goldsteinii]GKG81992.1 hypothetical protein CE91St2_51840 [Parabacteroides goldsteinii]